MLRNIPANLSPELVKTLMEMGHGDEIVLADANFPGHSMNARVIRADGLGVPDLLRSVLTLMPLDRFVEQPVALMATPEDDPEPPVWSTFREIWTAAEGEVGVEKVERFAFYDRARAAFAVVVTGETALYGNVILKKGVL